MILVISPPRMSTGLRSTQQSLFRKAGVPLPSLRWMPLTRGMSEPDKRRGKNSTRARPEYRDQFLHSLAKANPEFIVCCDPTALEYLTGRKSLYLCRGSNYVWNNRNVLVLGDPITYVQSKKNYGYKWAYENDCRKLARFLTGTTRTQPAYDYRLCLNADSLREAADRAERSVFVSVDVETNGRGYNAHITCVGYGCWGSDGKLRVYVIPFYRGDTRDSRAWGAPELEARARATVARINACETRKVLQNGAYDAAYFIRERAPLRNWWMDTSVAHHSYLMEAPKRLDFLASIYLDNVQYWKDESKAAEDAKEDTKSYDLPKDASGMERFWNYCGLDNYYTACLVPPLFEIVYRNEWVARNYRKRIYQVTGPALSMSMRGARVDKIYQAKLTARYEQEGDAAHARLKTITRNPEFNPRSWQQVQPLVYDVLRAKQLPRKGRTTDEKVLKIIQTQHPLLRLVIDLIFEAKKSWKIAGDYGSGLYLFNNRWMYTLSPTGTETGRYSSKEHAFWVGTNIQNPHKDGGIRAMVCADPGYVLGETDYSTSDAYFTAYSADEERYIGNLEGERDTHCIHAESFFKRPYEDIYGGYKEKEEWVVHSTKGVRQLSKRLGYGTSYGMSANGVFMQMGREATEAAARYIGYGNAAGLSVRQLEDICGQLQRIFYDILYPGLEPWIRDRIQFVVNNNGIAVAIGGTARKFLGEFKNDDVRRELQAFYPQAGTASNLNDALERIWYSDWEEKGGQLLSQTHDSILFQVPEDKLELIDELNNYMIHECTAPSGKKFTVPIECTVGRRWDAPTMAEWPCSLADIDAAENKFLEMHSMHM